MNLIKEIKIQYLMSFFISLSLSLLVPAIPIYALFLGASQFEIGLLGSFDSIAYFFSTLSCIFISKFIDLRKVLISSIFFYGFSCTLFTFIKNSFEAFLAIILRGFSLGIFWPVVEVLISKDFKIEENKTISRFTLSWSIGAILGSFSSGPLMEFLNLKYLFYLIGFSNILLALFSIPFIKKGSIEKSNNNKDYRIFFKLKDVWFLSLIYGFNLGIIFYLYPAYLEIIGFSQIFIGASVFSFFIFRAFFFWLYQKIFIKNVIEIGLFLCSLGFLNLFLLKNPILIILGTIFIGIGTSLIYSMCLKIVFSNIERNSIILTSFFEAILSIGFLLGPLIGGFLAEKELVYPYIMGFLFSIFSIFIFIKRKNI